MSVERVIELGAHCIVAKPLAGADVVREFAAQIVVKAALRQAREELACQLAEAVSSRKTSDLALDFPRVRLEQRRQIWSDQRGKALDGRHLGHLAEIRAAPLFTRMTIDRRRDRGRHVHETWLIPDLQAEPAQILGKFRAARGERDLRQKPKGMEKSRIV